MDLLATDESRLPLQRQVYPVAKRMLDIGICLFTLLFIWPLWALITILIRLDSPGPALFVQERVGLHGRRFRMYKFRTLYRDLDSTSHEVFMRSFVNGRASEAQPAGTIHKPFGDSQVTAMGRFLRKTSLDELPQILNVLKGDMSLVGPRPNVPWEVEEYKPHHCRRLEVLPGMTGLAQVNGRSCLSFDDIVEYDVEYVEHQSLSMDLRILYWTVPMVLKGVGVR
jgi:lipopolysaccharide/colanic/teichoic acid biosynthesis glycosyltransferase